MKIPSNIQQCFEELDMLLDEKNKQHIKEQDEDTFVVDAHFGLGMWMRNNWMLWSPMTRLAAYFNEQGVTEPDDISFLICRCYHRYLRNNEVDLDKVIDDHRI